MLDWLHRRYNNDPYIHRGNGIRWVCAEHVRNDSGFYAQRTADFIAVDMWPSTGNAVHGHEIKVNRPDWLAERRRPEKWLPFSRVCDYWWIVAPDITVVHPDELPVNWGLIVLGRHSLRVKKPAPHLHYTGGSSLMAHRAVQPIPKGFTASLLRAVAKTAERRAQTPV